MFDPDWASKPDTDAVVALFSAWVAAQALPGLTLEVVRAAGRTPLIFIEVPGSVDSTVLMYGEPCGACYFPPVVVRPSPSPGGGLTQLPGLPPPPQATWTSSRR